jgi:hypothetical protein
MEKKNDTRIENIQKLLLRLELWSSVYDGELLIGLLLFIGNLMFDIFFLRSLRILKKKQ